MERNASDVAFTPAVKAVQVAKGSRAAYARMDRGSGWETEVTPELAGYLSGLDMFYLGTSTALGQPYIQYRGGAPGFLKVVGSKTLAFADLEGNHQYITLGNLSENPKAFLFLMDYVQRRRIKVWGTARVVEGLEARIETLRDPEYPPRAIVFEVAAWDSNCPKHIHRRFPESAVAPVVDQLQKRIEELEAEVAALRGPAREVQ